MEPVADWLGAGSWGWLTGALPAVPTSPTTALLVPATLGLLWLYFQAGPSRPSRLEERARGRRRRAGQKEDQEEEGGGSSPISAVAHHYPGLHNHGNSCFLNSTLQCLASLRLLNGHLLQQATDRCPAEGEDALEGDDDSFTSLLFDLCVDLNELGPRRAMSPLPLIYKLQRRQPRLMDRDQQDAHEFFQLLSGILTDETRTLAEVQLRRDCWTSVLQRALPADIRSRVAVDSGTRLPRLKSPFSGLLASRMTCRTCLYSTPVRHSAFDNLSLPVGQVRGVRVEDLLAAYMEREHVEGWMCAKCTLTHTTCKVRAELEKLELMLVRAKERMVTARPLPPTEAGPEPRLPAAPDLVPSPKRRSKGEKLVQDLHVRIQRARDRLARIAHTLAYNVDSELDKLDLPLVKQYRNAVKETRIAAPPPILVLHMQRSVFTPMGEVYKNPNPVHYDLMLDITRYITGNGVGSCKYFASSFDLASDSRRASASSLLTMSGPTSRVWREDRQSSPSSLSPGERGLDQTPGLAEGQERSEEIEQEEEEDGPRLETIDDSPLPTAPSSPQPSAPAIPPPHQQSRYTYILSAVVLHYGSHYSGHFTCLRSVPDASSRRKRTTRRTTATSAAYPALSGRRWLSISDDVVTPCTLDAVCRTSPNVYLLFYERLDLLPPPPTATSP